MPGAAKMPGAARKCQAQKRPCLNAAHDHHPRWPFVTHRPSRVSTWSRQLALRGRVVDAEKRRFRFSSMVRAPVLKTARDHPLRLVRCSARARGESPSQRASPGHQEPYGFAQKLCYQGCSVVDRGCTVGSRPRRQGIVAPQLLGESALKNLRKLRVVLNGGLLTSGGLISPRPPPLSELIEESLKTEIITLLLRSRDSIINDGTPACIVACRFRDFPLDFESLQKFYSSKMPGGAAKMSMLKRGP